MFETSLKSVTEAAEAAGTTAVATKDAVNVVANNFLIVLLLNNI